ncbi:ATP phosphoribosyltransferase regulatory subunit [Vibrio stylophorae]|uniref:ATP phosphoribosyltransferase regulatory subunit n=1 Tax=Vibrio stylophorae TaxID=659351 RepID=A0ABN8DNK2_9VIBR|nr:ATP phosphoribosyltransferase regulatory subunit [Vibrio stylophorae]CAH0532741.1 ATP phosphoribosyltransferase regulatory subunit [Vibrio stylophorae]
MARKERLFIAGLPQLIALKGHNQQAVFETPADYHYFLQCLDNALQRYGGALHGYSLQPSQVLLLLTPKNKEGLGRFMQHIGRCYVPYFNQAHQRSGALWEGRYHSCHIEPGSYFLLCLQYVDIQAQQLSASSGSFRDHSWCSYQHHLGHDFQPRIDEHTQYRQLGETPAMRASAYSHFITTPLSNSVIERIESCLQQNCVLGTPQFCQSVEHQIHRHVRPRHSGRPRKHFHNPLQNWVWLEEQARLLFDRYGYQEIRLPLLEAHDPLEMVTDFTQGSVQAAIASHNAVLRHEGTLSCLRAVSQHQELLQQGKLWYQGPVFHDHGQEPSQVTQLHQIGAEAFGCEGVEIVLEQLLLQHHFFAQLNLSEQVNLRINHLGSADEFAQFRQALRDYFEPFRLVLDAQSLSWLEQTPERILHQHPSLLNALVAEAPRLHYFLSRASKQRFAKLTQVLREMDVIFEIQLELFPERDYSHTIFEWHCDRLGEDSLLCRGGRYDLYASEHLEQNTFACGFAFQLESLMKLIEQQGESDWAKESQNMVVIPRTQFDQAYAMQVTRQLRQTFPNSCVIHDCSHHLAEKSKQQALKRGMPFVLVVDEHASMPISLYQHHQNEGTELNLHDTIQTLMRQLPLQ